MPKADLYKLAESYRSEFPIFKSAIYLNTCSLGALSRRADAALGEFTELWNRWGASAWYERWLGTAAEVRSAFAELIGAGTDEIALAPSISAALSIITSAIDFADRPKVITTELDFPTLVYQFLAKEKLGVETVVLPSPDGITVPVDSFAQVVDEDTALIATSHIYFTSGAIQDVAALAELAHRHGALSLIDAYQSTGQIPVDARKLGVDFLLSGTLKWLLGGTGLAFVYVKEALIEELEPTAVSWFGVEDQFSFDTSTLSLRPDARRLELGTPAVPTIYTARAGLEIVREVGIEKIRRRISSLTDDLLDRISAAGLISRAAAEPALRSGIVVVEHDDPQSAVRRLIDAKVIVDYRPGAVRISPHFYNSTDDNEAAIGVLAG